MKTVLKNKVRSLTCSKFINTVVLFQPFVTKLLFVKKMVLIIFFETAKFLKLYPFFLKISFCCLFVSQQTYTKSMLIHYFSKRFET